jgi:putative ABC transport system permease protein
MFRSNLKIILRQLRNIYSLLNLIGLTVGFTVFTLIFLWVNEELSYDRFHPNHENIYRVVANQLNDKGENHPVAITPAPLAEYLKDNFGEIENTCKLRLSEFFLKYEDAGFYKQGLTVDPSFFTIFNYPLKQGSISNFYEGVDKIIISQQLAESYFGKADPIGKVFLIGGRDVVVIAVMENVPTNSQLQFDFVIPIKFVEAVSITTLDKWTLFQCITYIKTKGNESQASLEEKIKNIVIKKDPESYSTLYLQPLVDMHLKSTHLGNDLTYAGDSKISKGNIQYVNLFSLLALFVLIIASINYSNLATARSIKRSKETGVRKVLGSSRLQLAGYFFSESILYCVLALGAALLISWLLLPSFNELTGKQLELHLFTKISAYLVASALFCALVGGAYPALMLSSQNPVVVLKGLGKASNKTISLRRVLVVVQFILSISLLTGTLIIKRQLDYINSKNLGYSKENMLSFTAIRKVRAQYPSIKSELLQLAAVKNVTASNSSISFADYWTDGLGWEGKDPNAKMIFQQLVVEHDFLKTYSIPIVAGRDFSAAIASDSSAALLNEEAVAQMKLTDPLNKVVTHNDKKYTVIGIVKNFHFKSIHTKIEPLVIYIDPTSLYQISIKLNKGNFPEQIKQVEAVFKKVIPDRPFDYTVLDGDVQKLYLAENRTGKIFQYLSGLSIFVSCLGLLGIIIFVTEQRAKELAIRKVLGAPVYKLMLMLSIEYIIMAFIGFCIAAPIMYYAMGKWLAHFAYQVKITVGLFLFAGLVSLLFAWLTVAYRSYKAAMDNPVDSLRSE